MYVCLTLKTKTETGIPGRKKKGSEDKYSPILVPVGIGTTFFIDNSGDTKVNIAGSEWILEETIEQLAKLINNSGLRVANMDAMMARFFPKEVE